MRASFVDVVQKGQEDAAYRLLLTHGDDIDLEEEGQLKDGTALYWASALGLYHLVNVLLLKGANVQALTRWRSTPLHAAADHGHAHVVRSEYSIIPRSYGQNIVLYPCCTVRI